MEWNRALSFATSCASLVSGVLGPDVSPVADPQPEAPVEEIAERAESPAGEWLLDTTSVARMMVKQAEKLEAEQRPGEGAGAGRGDGRGDPSSGRPLPEEKQRAILDLAGSQKQRLTITSDGRFTLHDELQRDDGGDGLVFAGEWVQTPEGVLLFDDDAGAVDVQSGAAPLPGWAVLLSRDAERLRVVAGGYGVAVAPGVEFGRTGFAPPSTDAAEPIRATRAADGSPFIGRWWYDLSGLRQRFESAAAGSGGGPMAPDHAVVQLEFKPDGTTFLTGWIPHEKRAGDEEAVSSYNEGRWYEWDSHAVLIGEHTDDSAAKMFPFSRCDDEMPTVAVFRLEGETELSHTAGTLPLLSAQPGIGLTRVAAVD